MVGEDEQVDVRDESKRQKKEIAAEGVERCFREASTFKSYPPPNPGRISFTSFANLIEIPFVTTICFR